MELREFAEQVLFATTLEEKLRGPADITDERPGAPRSTPMTPGRPSELRFKGGGIASGGFSAKQLESERDRGQLLHFFANHELLATELMALALLRFTDAPSAFRNGILQTLRDEQEHTRLYVERMRAAGIQFGELPVSGYFWRAISGMENPIDYVAGLSLTFEQANLDFARYFSREFERVGDAEGARLLDRIYQDEIRHVAYGLKWFRRWKNPDQSDWQAFCCQLKYPLSPQRAKGFALNVEGRRAAGLDAAFIAELDVYSQSKGRTPVVFVFNPLSEGYLARGRAFSPVKYQAQLSHDLANLPQFLCRQDDIVLVPQRPSVDFLRSVKQAGFALPEFVELGGDPSAAIATLSQRKLGGLRPWAWGPDSQEMLGPLQERVRDGGAGAQSQFNGRMAALYSKSWSTDFLRSFLAGRASIPWLCTAAEVGRTARTLDAALHLIESIRRSGHHRVVVKESLGLAGRNAIRLWEPAVLPQQLSWMQSALTKKIPLVIEPWLEREFDFSIQLERGSDGLRLLGYTTLRNDPKGQYVGNAAASNHARQLPAEIAEHIGGPADAAFAIQALFRELIDSLEKQLAQAGHVGPVGVDAFVYRDAAGQCRIKPVVEINPRYTMGRLTLELMRQTCPGSRGELRLVTRRVAREGYENFSTYARDLQMRFPVELAGEPVQRIRSGVVLLNDPEAAKVCLAVFQVTRAGPLVRKSGQWCTNLNPALPSR